MTGSGLGSIFHSTAFHVTTNLVLFFVVVFWLGLAYWVYRDARIRTADPFSTSEVLYQLSYVGEGTSV